YNGNGNSIDVSRVVFVPLSNKAAFVTGFSRNDPNPGKEDILSIKYDLTNGTQLQSVRYNGPGNRSDAAYALVVDTSDHIYLAGYSEGNSSGYNFITMKYLNGELIKVVTISSNVPKDFKLYQNYPNPFNPNTTIRFDLVKSSNVKLNVYDLPGRQVATLMNEFLQSGSYEVIFNMPKLSSGVYFYEIVTNEFRDMKKMILVK
ncbi:MAG: T9SS type A sorting domain-containing protein, partial [Ignavibacteria bacterium]